MESCLFCGIDAEKKEEHCKNTALYSCPNCGNYQVAFEFKNAFNILTSREYIKLPIETISGYIRECTNKHLDLPIIDTKNINSFVDLSKIPNDINSKANKILEYIYGKTQYFGESININFIEKAIAYAKNEEEFEALLSLITEEQLVREEAKTNLGAEYKLTINGMEYCDRNKNKNSESKKAFIAMWFSELMLNVYEVAIKTAIEECGYKPILISKKEHLNEITDEIMAEIKTCKFVVADLSGARGGVYYEAGYAYGKNIPVIWMCNKKWFTPRRIHFDVNHFPFIIWQDENELKVKLINRIKSAIEET
jgi:nucleoside 2-deoxyribosyltransferase